MTIVILVSALLVAIVAHEAAHARVSRSLGMPIIEAGLGMPFPPVLMVRVKRVPFTLTLSPWLVGAYVKLSDEDEAAVGRLSYRDRAWLNNAGIVANLLLMFAFAGVAFAISGRSPAASVATALALATWCARRWVAAYVLPALALPALVFAGLAMAESWSQGRTGLGFAGLPALVPSGGVVRYLMFFAALNFAVVAVNMLPLHGLDNGKVVGELLERWAGPRVGVVYRATGLALVGLTMLAAIGSDLWALLT